MQNAKVLSDNSNNVIPENIVEMAKQRAEAKKVKNYALADELRNKISDAGWIVEDTATGFNIKVK